MKKIISSEREKRVFVLSCLTLLIFIVYRGVYVPLKNIEESTQDKILTLEKQLNKAQQTINKSKPFEQDYPEASVCFKQTIPDKEQINFIDAEIKKLAQENELVLKSTPPVKSKTTPLGNNFSQNISLTGTFENILEFLYNLQNCPHLYTINELQIKKSQNAESRIDCKLILTKSLIK